MPRVKIIKTISFFDNEYYTTHRDIEEVSEWETVSDEDLDWLKRWLDKKNKHSDYGNYRGDENYSIMIFADPPIPVFIAINEMVAATRAQEEKDRKVREKATATRARSALARAEKRREMAEAEIARLKEKNG